MPSVFSPDAGTQPPTTPWVGIANGAGSLGPQFNGVTAVTALFNQLIATFPNLNYVPAPNTPHCYSTNDGNTINGNTITVQTVLYTGTLQQKWFPRGHKAYSLPLSEIDPDPLGAAQSTLPACAVFTFDANHLISQLGIYLDRWQMAADLWPGKHYRPFPQP